GRRRHGSARGGAGAQPEVPRLSGREPLAALGAAALQDQPPRARGHACAKAVLALPPAYVGLVGPLHERMETKKEPPEGSRAQYRRVVADGCRAFSTAATAGEARAARLPRPLAFPQVWRFVWIPKMAQIAGFLSLRLLSSR